MIKNCDIILSILSITEALTKKMLLTSKAQKRERLIRALVLFIIDTIIPQSSSKVKMIKNCDIILIRKSCYIKNMKDESLEIHSPYIKNSSNGIEEMRKKIANKSHRDEESNLLIVRDSDNDKSSSDSLLRQKILSLSKRAVGEEIRKFAEVASREIGEEFERLENRINKRLNESDNNSFISEVSKRIGNVEKAFYQEMANHNDNILSVREGLGKEIDRKISLLNEKLTEIENKLKNIKSLATEKDLNVLMMAENEIKEVAEIEEDKNEDFILDEEEAKKYINKKMKNVAGLFERDGVLFKKNVFLSNIKNKEVEDFLNFKEGYEDIEDKDKDLIEKILIELMENLDIDPKSEEEIGDFLQRAYRKEYAKMS
jgi:hypothetical protein